MNASLRAGLSCLSLLIAFAASAQTAPIAPAAMDRPALISKRAAGATMLAVARAGKRVVAAGERGIVLVSDDAGASWQQASVPTSASLLALRFVDERQGWAVGHMGIVLHTEDGGLTWSKQLDGVQAAQLALAAATRSGDDKLIRQAQLLVDDGPDKPFFDLYFDNERTGWIVGAYNLAFRTDDGGRNWRPLLDRIDNPRAFHLYGICKVDGALLVAGEQGLMLRSDDGGEQFKALKSPYKGSWFGLQAFGAGKVLAYGLRGNAYVSGDRGQTWQAAASGTPASISAATSLADGRLVIVSQAGQVLASADDGRSFEPLPARAGLPLAGVAQVDGSLVLASLRGVVRVPLAGAAR